MKDKFKIIVQGSDRELTIPFEKHLLEDKSEDGKNREVVQISESTAWMKMYNDSLGKPTGIKSHEELYKAVGTMLLSSAFNPSASADFSLMLIDSSTKAFIDLGPLISTLKQVFEIYIRSGVEINFKNPYERQHEGQ